VFLLKVLFTTSLIAQIFKTNAPTIKCRSICF